MKTIKPISDPALRVKEVVCDDLVIIMRPVKNELEVITEYVSQTVTSSDLCASIIAQSLQALGQILPRTDPADGKSLWIKDGCFAFASGNPAKLGGMAPYTMQKSLAEAFKILPISDPGDGGPWLNGGVLMQGSKFKKKG